MDHEFWEDENELPYLVWETRDDRRSKVSTNNKSMSNEKKLDAILNSINVSSSQRIVLKDKLLEFFNAKDCVNLTVEDGFDGCTFIFTRENRYIKTTDSFEYLPGIAQERIFYDCYTSHNYDNLIGDSRFRSMIERTGLEFIECQGGYVTEFSGRTDTFTMKDELNLRVHLRAGSTVNVYLLDLEKMELGEKFYKYCL